MSFHRLARDATKPAVGRDIDAWCTRCKRELGHTITAMVSGAVVQVRCDSCGGVHKFRTPAGEKTKARATTPTAKSKARVKAAKISAEVRRFQQRLAQRDVAAATGYTPRIDPDVGELIKHARFGLGIVDAVTGNKATVLFEGGKKMLIICR